MGMRQHRPHATQITFVSIINFYRLSAGYVNQLNRKVPFSTFDEILFTISENDYCHGWLLQLYKEWRKTGQRGAIQRRTNTGLDPIVLCWSGSIFSCWRSNIIKKLSVIRISSILGTRGFLLKCGWMLRCRPEADQSSAEVRSHERPETAHDGLWPPG